MADMFEEQMGEWVRNATLERAQVIEEACETAVEIGCGVRVHSWFVPPSTFNFQAVPALDVPAGEIHEHHRPPEETE
jgi:hypothetical protein